MMTNEQVLNRLYRVGEERSFLKWIKRILIQLIGYLVWHEFFFEKDVRKSCRRKKIARKTQIGVHETLTEGREKCFVLRIEAESRRSGSICQSAVLLLTRERRHKKLSKKKLNNIFIRGLSNLFLLKPTIYRQVKLYITCNYFNSVYYEHTIKFE
jgi:hypothetical protein